VSRAAAHDISVAFATFDQSALVGVDYEGAAGTLVIPAGDIVGEIVVRVVGNLVAESDRTFLVVLSDAIGAELYNAEAVATIADDDILDISVADASLLEADAAMVFTVSLAVFSEDVVTLSYTTVDGTASAPLDYLPISVAASAPTAAWDEAPTRLESRWGTSEGSLVDELEGQRAMRLTVNQ
jgi:hypothetical protein